MMREVCCMPIKVSCAVSKISVLHTKRDTKLTSLPKHLLHTLSLLNSLLLPRKLLPRSFNSAMHKASHRKLPKGRASLMRGTKAVHCPRNKKPFSVLMSVIVSSHENFHFTIFYHRTQEAGLYWKQT